MNNNYPDFLNPEQWEAVKNINNPVLVLAGAGSGKTRVITYKMYQIITEHNISPYNILALTFTNKAAGEMKKRISTLIQKDEKNAKGLWVSTFHSTCARILRREAEKVGLSVNFTIYDDDDAKKVIKEIMKKINVKYFKTPSDVYYQIALRKNKPYPTIENFTDKLYGDSLWAVYEEYEKRLLEQNAVDFNNIILKTINLFSSNSDALNHYQNMFKYVLVDEFQDTNEAQYELIRLISQKSGKITVVGDDDQSIYAFRGAYVKNLINFTEDYKDCEIIRLEQNYRSTKNILTAANSIIENNEARLGKTLWSHNEEGETISVITAVDEREEGRIIVDLIKKQLHQSTEIAVFYRINSLSRIIEELLKQSQIPYQIFGSLKFYERREIKDILAYLYVIVNPRDDLNLKRIINVPRRGIGEKTVSELEQISESLLLPLFDTMKYVIDNSMLSKGVIEKIKNFTDIIDELSDMLKELSPLDFVKAVLKKTKYPEYLSLDDPYDERLNNINSFLSGVEEYVKTNNDDCSIQEFLNNVSLYSEIDSFDEFNSKVYLMTVHNAKGLEFDTVFVIGLEENIFPHYLSSDSSDDVEEERRLFYVALTRARKKVFLSCAKMRNQYYNVYINKPSRFIGEIDKSVCSFSKSSNKNFFDEYNLKAKYRNCGTNIDSLKGDEIEIGDLLIHDNYGKGIVTFKSGEKDLVTVKIMFDEQNEKIFVVKYANLKRSE